MDLIQFVEQKTNKKINISESELREILNSQNDTVCSYEEVKEELIDDWRINSYIVDYVDFSALAENDGFEKVNNDTYIRKYAFEEFCKHIKEVI